MNAEASATLQESDLILLVVDASQPPHEEDHRLFGMLARLPRLAPLLLALNKIDLLDEQTLTTRQANFLAALNLTPLAVQPVSASRGDGLETLLETILEHLPQGEPFFPPDQLTDLYERELAADLIRQTCLNLLRDEIPHGIAVRIDQYTERGEQGAYIEATLFVERESHKPIVIGREGQMLKQIGVIARQEIEAMSERKVFLQLKVKVRKNWRDDEKVLKNFGY
jgi:GTP-binding protein Era